MSEGVEVVDTNILTREWYVAPETTYKAIEHKAAFGAEGYQDDSEEWKSFEHKAFSVLEKMGYLEIEDGALTLDLDRFRKFESKEFTRLMKIQDGAPLEKETLQKYGSGAVSAVVNLFWDREVKVKGRNETLKALSIPETKRAGLSEEHLRSSEAAINLWELGRSAMPDNYPTMADGWDSNLSTHDYVIGTVVVNHRFGYGSRDQTGESDMLLVNYPEGRRRPISADFFREWSVSGKPTVVNGESIQINNRPYEFVLKRCHELKRRGILVPEDFQRQEDMSFGVGAREISSKGIVWADGKALTVGAEYAGASLYRMSPNLAAIVSEENGNLLVKSVVELNKFNNPETNVVPHFSGSDYDRVRKDGVIMYDPDEIQQKFQEDPEFAGWVENFEDFLALSQELYRETDIDVSTFSLREQLVLLDVFGSYDEKGKEFLFEFAKHFKSEGLRALVLCKDAAGETDKVLSIGLNSEPPFWAEEVFKETALIADTISNVVGENFADGLWAQEARKRAAELVLAAYPVSQGEDTGYGLSEVSNELRLFRVNELDRSDKGYMALLKRYSEADEDQKPLLVRKLVNYWKHQIYTEKKRGRAVFEAGKQQVIESYAQVEELEDQADQTTGSNKHLELARDFVQRMAEAKGEQIKVLDAGAGSGLRITTPLSTEFPNVDFTGVDLRQPRALERENLHFQKGDFTSLPHEDGSFDAVYSVWSPWMDVLGFEGQIMAAFEMHRILTPGGELMIEAADLEGEGKSWQATAAEYKRTHPESQLGTIVENVPGLVGEREFNIFPKEQLTAMLEAVGFTDVRLEQYQTENNVPRMVVYARKP